MTEYSSRVYKVTKNNSLELHSLVLLKEGKNFAPNIYLQPYYEAYQKGAAMKDLADRLCSIYQGYTTPIVEDKFDYSFDRMKAVIIYRLVSYDRNKKLLEKVPHMKYLDLAITYHCLVREDEEGIGTIRITNEHMENWNVKLTDIHKMAISNTQRLFPHNISSMEEVMKGLLTLEYNTETAQKRMYILSNQKGINGASCLLYKDVLTGFAKKLESDFYVFPSSIHEVILVLASDLRSSKEYSEMVREINRTQVAEDEVLSDNIYFFSRTSGLRLLE
ncbi:MAG TPA: DUF5688 family protein [Lachnospiraceae bacterium]|nr:DUF5688 family protein [Lachnospiraceae bacterium]